MEKLIYLLAGVFIGIILATFTIFHLPQTIVLLGRFSDYVLKTANHSCSPPEGYVCTKN